MTECAWKNKAETFDNEKALTKKGLLFFGIEEDSQVVEAKSPIKKENLKRVIMAREDQQRKKYFFLYG